MIFTVGTHAIAARRDAKRGIAIGGAAVTWTGVVSFVKFADEISAVGNARAVGVSDAAIGFTRSVVFAYLTHAIATVCNA